ncbi:hypothetical protein C4N9_10950 [Pararhodobacter marinus]|uniref:Lipoprotein n=1 Tax=Pararhodobacter marinus TaxID=2184063 RepID=A0A2U2C9E5_9RHOB|nr:hypothetical protein [Pararhodobacter marinus]PWE28505.1 hypothetical protein C4N9_10950 [Pararhodobacter marinus]
MRALALLLCLSLAACGGGERNGSGPVADTSDMPVAQESPTGTAMDDTPADGAAVSGAQAPAAPEILPESSPESPPETAPPSEPPFLAQQRALCRERGGQLMARGTSGLYACVETTRDGGQACDEGSDCEGLCLARSGTCAPLTPIFGCQEVYTARGRRETLCTE